MPEMEKVIMALELHRAGKCQDTNRQLCPYWECDDDCYKQMADDILSILKKREAAEPLFNEILNHFVCPNCSLVLDEGRDDYCPSCGKQIAWSEYYIHEEDVDCK